ncbi:hypothetical protein DSM112329_03044 [Paraconexibacter sp. AEG42_29]|uniref:Lipoprotein n=1 Tax=Paraconexibacter sp. AEG42_29 TaxID=2997339 RepID=A0AAU7AXZ4_9ACTN
MTASRSARRSLCTLPLLLALVASGCGKERQPSPDVKTPGPVYGSENVRYPAAGLEFPQAPSGWSRSLAAAPAIVTIATGEATIGIFRYPRTEALPKTKKDLDNAATALIAAAKARDPSFTELKRARLKVDGQPAVQIRGTETIAGKPRTVRTTHIYAFGGEIVVDAYAPEKDFRRVDTQAFRPLVASMKITAPTSP